MAIILIDDSQRFCDFLDIATLKIEPVTYPGAPIDASYRLLQRVFDPAVVDPLDSYVTTLDGDSDKNPGCVPIFLAGYFDVEGDKLVAGFIGSNLMTLQSQPEVYILAIGNIATSPLIKAAELKGVGTALLDAALRQAVIKSKESGGKLMYSVAEAESASLGFWRKRGYLWPQGLRYFQPPLEFDDSGMPVFSAVQETLVIAAFKPQIDCTIDAEMLRDVIVTLYENWCLRGYRLNLSPQAMRNAETYVMQRVLGRVSATIPKEGEIPLLDPVEATLSLFLIAIFAQLSSQVVIGVGNGENTGNRR